MLKSHWKPEVICPKQKEINNKFYIDFSYFDMMLLFLHFNNQDDHDNVESTLLTDIQILS